ncbi:MAG: hypothetical protein WA175_00710 [Candidatus Acidiferrales bacterium]
MSKRSERLAVSVRQALKQRPSDEAMLQRIKMLDTGWLRVKETLRNEIESQIEELRKEPDCASVVFASLSGERWEIKRTDDPQCAVSIKFDSEKRLVSVKSDKPFVFTYFIEVQLNRNETSYFYMAGEKKNDLGSADERTIAYLADKCLYGLFGVEK